MPLSFFAGLHSAELMSRIVTDVNRLARVSSTVLIMAIRQIAMVVALLSVMVVREWRLAVIALVVFPFVGVAVRSIGRRLYRINKRSQEKVAELNVLLHEAFSGMKIVKAFGREGHEAERFERVNRRLLDLALKDHRTDEITEPLMEVLAAFGIMGALLYGGHQVIAGAMTPGRLLLLHRRAGPDLRAGPPALAHHEHRPAVGLLGRARVRDPRPAAGHRRPPRRRTPCPPSGRRSASRASPSAIPTRPTSRCATSRWTSGAARWWRSWG